MTDQAVYKLIGAIYLLCGVMTMDKNKYLPIIFYIGSIVYFIVSFFI